MIDETGTQLGILPTEKALEIARERGFDLVEIAPTASPPVAKLADYGKFLYQLEKEERKSRLHRHEGEIKAIRLTLKIASHDMEVRAEQARKFLAKGHRVQIDLVLRGREKAHRDFARQKLDEFLTRLAIPYKVIQEPKNAPRGILMMIQKA